MKKFFVSDSTPETLLKENGEPYACPFAPPMAVQNRITGEIQTVYTPCSADCLFYDSIDNRIQDANGHDKTVFLKCSMATIEADIKFQF